MKGKIILGAVFFLLCLIPLSPGVAAITLTPGASSGSTPTIAKGDPVYINGIATGQPQNGLRVWLVGYNHVKIDSVSVNNDNTYSYELKPADTANLATGQYLVIIQHPMMNGKFDITYDASSGTVINQQLGSGTAIFQLTGPGSLQSPDAGYSLMQAINNQNIDDSFATASFIVNDPQALINPVGDHAVGDRFTIGGSTNLAAGDNLMVEISSSSFKPTEKVQSGEFSGTSGEVQVMQGTNGYNQWSLDVDASAFKPDEYIVRVSGITLDVTDSATFNIVERLPTTIATPVVTTASPVITAPSTAVPTMTPTLLPTTKNAPVFPGIIVAGLVLSLVLLHAGRRN
jgi:hypothetical protein